MAYVYFMTNQLNTVLYTGVTNDLARREAEHMLGQSTFTDRYRCTKLVYYEADESILGAIEREKRVKRWKRSWKNQLVDQFNPGWDDLSSRIGVTPAVLAYVRRDPGSSPG